MTNDIYVLNQSLVLQGIVDNYESFIMHMRHGDISYIQIVLDTEAANANKMVKGNIIYSPSQLNCPCIITETPTMFDGEGRTKTVLAYDVFWWFKKRLANITTSDVTYTSQTVEYIIKDLLTNNLTGDREVTYLSIASGTTLGSTIDLTVKQLPLYDVIVGLLSIDGLGLKGTFNGTSIEIDVYAGTDRSEDNGVNPHVIFDLDYNNIIAGETVSSNTFTTNFAYILGVDGSGNRIVTSVGTATDNDRLETMVDGGDVSDTGELQDIGNAALQPLEEGASYSTQALTGSFIYDTHYSLGDIVTVVGQDLRITEVEIVREEGNPFQVFLTFGQPQKEASDQIYELNTRVTKLEAKLSSGGGGGVSGINKNYIINGNFDIAQRGTLFTSATTPANNDDTYLLDMWNLISDGNDVVDVSQEAITDLPGSNYTCKLDIETAKRCGIVQFIEAGDAQKFNGKNVSLSFAVKSANISAIRAAVLSWDSTADTITSDVVSSWAATPTWATNWTAENTPSDLAVSSSWTTVTVENISIDTSGTNNIAIVLWLPNEETIGDIIYISQVKLEISATVTDYEPNTYAREFFNCQRYYQIFVWNGIAYNTQYISCAKALNAPMRKAPTPIQIYGGIDGITYPGQIDYFGSGLITVTYSLIQFTAVAASGLNITSLNLTPGGIYSGSIRLTAEL